MKEFARRGMLWAARRIARGADRMRVALERPPRRPETPAFVSRNAELRGRYAGRRCFIIGNGPSLGGQDLAPLSDEITIAANGFWKHPIIEQWQPTYYCFADPVFFDGSPAMAEFFARLRERVPDSHFVVPSWAEPRVRTEAMLPEDQVSYVLFEGDISTADAESSIDLAGPVPGVINVAELAIMTAVHLGCSPIYLLGLDHDWLAHRGVNRYFYTSPAITGHPTAVVNLATENYRHLMECQLALWRGYEALDRLARAKGVRIVNATDGGFLDVFERAEYASLFATV